MCQGAAEWINAITNIGVCITALYIALRGDAIYRKMSKENSFKFKEETIYPFIQASISSWRNKDEVPISGGSNITVEDNIQKFRQNYLKLTTILDRETSYLANKALVLAKKHAISWETNGEFKKLYYQNQLLLLLNKVAESIGKEAEMAKYNTYHHSKRILFLSFLSDLKNSCF
ncbi:Uncharacterised protein [Legionella donaldsonii]|uniref:Uncharacterized protein n=2 Tax=Legionella donaldsonii TaxID=45060 RepID=A0A378J043_9GAMM|nr:Uncharacterised protein [Legionella donaldsonii]